MLLFTDSTTIACNHTPMDSCMRNRSKLPTMAIPATMDPGDTLILRNNLRRTWDRWTRDGVAVCQGPVPAVFNKEGTSWSDPGCRAWDVVGVERARSLKRIRIPGGMVEGDFLLLRNGSIKVLTDRVKNSRVSTTGDTPNLFTTDGFSWLERSRSDWDVVGAGKESELMYLANAGDYLQWLVDRQPVVLGPAQLRRLAAVAMQLKELDRASRW